MRSPWGAAAAEPAVPQPGPWHGPPDDPEGFARLRAEVDRLGRALGWAIRTLSGERLFALEEEVRALTKHLRRHPGDQECRRRLEQIIRGLSVEEAEGLVRAFSTYFQLVNLAEERHRVRVNRMREAASTPARPRPESALALMQQLQAMGLDREQALALLRDVRLELTFTAHPTEVRRRTVRHHLRQIAQVLEAMERGEADEDALRARVALLWTTYELRDQPPTVADEVEGGLYYLHTTVWEALPRLVVDLERAFAACYGAPAELAPPFAFRSWIGGDRDGNPNVTPEVTDWAQRYARRVAAGRYLDALQRLIRDLSPSPRRLAAVARAGEAGAPASGAPAGVAPGVPPVAPATAGEPDEPYRALLRRLAETVRAAGDDPRLQGAEELLRSTLEGVERSLAEAGLAEAARLLVRPLRLRAQAFGLDLAALDLREEAGAHAEAVAELLAAGGACPDYLALDPAARERLLTQELATARPLMPVGYVPRSRALAVALGALRAWSSRGGYVVSMAGHPADVLEVFVLAREVGLYEPGRGLPFDVVPLFERRDDLRRAPEVVDRLLRNPVFRAHVDCRGGFEVMIGYSDSNKDVGFLAANWALYRAQEEVASVARRHGVAVRFFHGRGTSTARGGAPAGLAIAGLPPGTVGGRLRLTEQGEALADRYGHADLAFRNLEQLLYHFVLASARDRHGAPAPLPERYRAAMEEAATAAAACYRQLVEGEGFLAFFEELTPIREIGRLHISSRPLYRHGRVRDLGDLRAIPWVMAWTQVRANVPGWYGLGTGLAAIPAELRREMYRTWPFFRALLETAAMSAAKADLHITRGYLRLVRDAAAGERFFGLIQEEFRRTVTLLEDTFGGPLLAGQPVLRRAIELRNPYVDPISHVQVELLARFRALPEDHPDRPHLERALLLSILGIAAGLRNTG